MALRQIADRSHAAAPVDQRQAQDRARSERRAGRAHGARSDEHRPRVPHDRAELRNRPPRFGLGDRLLGSPDRERARGASPRPPSSRTSRRVPTDRPTPRRGLASAARSEEHTSALQSLMRNSYAAFRLQKKNTYTTYNDQ